MVSLAPKNLQTTITIGSNLAINVTAKADWDFFYILVMLQMKFRNFMEGSGNTPTPELELIRLKLSP
jgi:hypothetical protein